MQCKPAIKQINVEIYAIEFIGQQRTVGCLLLQLQAGQDFAASDNVPSLCRGNLALYHPGELIISL